MMKKATLAAVIAAIGATGAHAGTVTTDGSDIVINTKGGFEAKTTDGKYSFKIGGRMMLDYNHFDGVINKKVDENGSDLFFRRARLEIKCKYEDWLCQMSYNLTSSGSIDQLNATYAGFGPLALVTFGQQKENFGLEDTGSSKWITAMERSMPANAFDTGNTVGVKLSGSTPLITYSIGAFKNSIDSEDNSLDFATTGRFVVRPLHEEGRLVHLGVGFTQRDGEFTKLNSRLGVRGGESGGLVNKAEVKYDSGLMADEQSAWNGELAASFGSVHFMAEYFDGELSGMDGAPDIEVDGYYGQLGWIVTGETRTYKNGIAAFDKVKPKGSNGAFEVFVRVDHLDFSDNDGVPGIHALKTGEDADTLTLGLNWYANSAIKVSLNYVHAEVDWGLPPAMGGSGLVDDGDALVARLQFVF